MRPGWVGRQRRVVRHLGNGVLAFGGGWNTEDIVGNLNGVAAQCVFGEGIRESTGVYVGVGFQEVGVDLETQFRGEAQ